MPWGAATRRPTGRWSLTDFDDHHRGVVERLARPAEGLDDGFDFREQILGAARRDEQALETLVPEHLAAVVFGFDAAVGVEEEEIARGKLHARFGVTASREKPHRQARRGHAI